MENDDSLVELWKSTERALDDNPAKDTGSMDITEGNEAISDVEKDEASAQPDSDVSSDSTEKVSVSERVKFREQMREAKRKIEAERASIRAELESERDKFTSERKTLEAFREAAQSGDWDGLAKALGKAGWEELNKEVFASFQDPSYRRVRELERWKAEQENISLEIEKKRSTEAQAAAAEREYANYLQHLSSEMSSSDNELTRELARDQEFLSAVFQHQWDERDPATGTTISVADAVDSVLNSMRSNPLLKARRKIFNLLLADTEDEEPDQGGIPEARNGSTARGGSSPEKSRRRKSVTQSGANDTAAAVSKELSDEEWKALAIKRLRAADGM